MRRPRNNNELRAGQNGPDQQGTKVGQSSRQPGKVAVLMGGPSREREVSLSSGRECAAALRDANYDVVELDAGPDLQWGGAEGSREVYVQIILQDKGGGK